LLLLIVCCTVYPEQSEWALLYGWEFLSPKSQADFIGFNYSLNHNAQIPRASG
jgi:hypothetical protein